MRRLKSIVLAILFASSACAPSADTTADILLAGGSLLDGTGSDAQRADVAVTGDRISFVGDAGVAGIEARDTLDVSGLLVAPGFIDMHSHAELDEDYGRAGQAFLFQGVTTVAKGVDGDTFSRRAHSAPAVFQRSAFSSQSSRTLRTCASVSSAWGEFEPRSHTLDPYHRSTRCTGPGSFRPVWPRQ